MNSVRRLYLRHPNHMAYVSQIKCIDYWGKARLEKWLKPTIRRPSRSVLSKSYDPCRSTEMHPALSYGYCKHFRRTTA